MSIGRTLLKPVAYFASLRVAGQVRAFGAAHRRTRHLQQKLLKELVRRHASTAFGRDHGFRHVRCYEDFASAVPVSSYDTLRPYIRRVLAGETTALLPAGEPVLMFSMTSGTTAAPKYIPVTPRFLADTRRGWNIFGLKALRDHPEAWLRNILQISSPMRETVSPTGVPCGAISGLLAATQKRIVRRMYVVPQRAYEIADPDVKRYVILRCGVGRDVAFITTANPSSTIKLIETGQAHTERLIRDVADGTITPPGDAPPEATNSLQFRPNLRLARQIEAGIRRDGQLMPRHFWNLAFLANWTGGTLKLYLPRLRELFGDVPVRDIGLLASEGRFSIPLTDGSPAGVAEITANFLEFIPADQAESQKPDTLLADETEIGQEYLLVTTNWAGLWRYNMDDRVRVIDKLGGSPVFEFLSRGRNTTNITGEKITEYQVVEAMRLACLRNDRPIDRFVLRGRFAQTPYYELCLEAQDRREADHLAGLIDEALGELNMEYRSKRSSGRLGPIRAAVLPAEALVRTEAELIRKRHGRSEQYKHQYLATDIVAEE